MKQLIRFPRILLAAFLVFAASCEKPVPAPGPEPGPDPTPNPDPAAPTMFYSVNGSKHEITNVALFEKVGEGYNIVFSDSDAPLCPGYDMIGNHSFSLFSVDLASVTEGRKIVVGEDEVDSDDWSFYIGEWDRESYVGSIYDSPVSGSYEFDVDGSNLKIEISVKFEGGTSFELVYEGPVVRCDDYIWCGMSGKGSFGVNDDVFFIEKASLYQDAETYGYELVLSSGEQRFIVDFAEALVGKTTVVGKDSLTPVDEDDTVIWSFLTITIIDGHKEKHVDGENGPFASGYVDCVAISDGMADIDMSLTTNDGQTLDLHFHGSYERANNLYRL